MAASATPRSKPLQPDPPPHRRPLSSPPLPDLPTRTSILPCSFGRDHSPPSPHDTSSYFPSTSWPRIRPHHQVQPFHTSFESFDLLSRPWCLGSGPIGPTFAASTLPLARATPHSPLLAAASPLGPISSTRRSDGMSVLDRL